MRSRDNSEASSSFSFDGAPKSHAKSPSMMSWFQGHSKKQQQPENFMSNPQFDLSGHPSALEIDTASGDLWKGATVLFPLKDGNTCSLRLATVNDCDRIYLFIQELAESQKSVSAITMEELRRDGFTPGVRPRFQVILVFLDAELVAFTLFHETYSSWRGKCLHIEDLYVREKHRGEGIGTLLLRTLGRRAAAESCHRLTWQSMAWNERANDFYAKIGGKKMDGLLNWQVEGDAALRDFCKE